MTPGPGSTARASGVRADYRPHLDGVRCVSVVLVVAFHSEISAFSGGFVGVDVFFVLSGYLVTGLLLSEVAATQTVRLASFYGRRVRRLLPMAVLVLVVTGLAYAITAPPALVLDAADSFRAAFLYVTNWYFIAESTEYLGSDLDASPILHYWSLAIEEQFYVVWPLIMVGAWKGLRRFGPRWSDKAAAGTLLVAAASLAWAFHLSNADPDRAYFGTDARAYQLLFGATVALLPALSGTRRRRVIVKLAGPIAGVVLLVMATDLFEMSTTSRGAIAALSATALLIAIESGFAPRLNRALSATPLVTIGLLSYSIYLWHLPVIYVLGQRWDLDPTVRFGLTMIISVGLAQTSGRLLETPVRRSRRLERVPRPVIATGLAISIVAGLLAPSALRSAADAPDIELDWEAAKTDTVDVTRCALDTAPEDCTIRRGTGLHVALVGDSHARVWQGAMELIAEERDLTLSVVLMQGCSWHHGAVLDVKPADQERCLERQDDWYSRVLPELAPDVVVLTHRAMFDPALVLPADETSFLDATTRSIAELRALGAQIVILEPTPVTAGPNDPLVCISRGGPVDDCGFDASPGPTVLEARRAGRVHRCRRPDVPGTAAMRRRDRRRHLDEGPHAHDRDLRAIAGARTRRPVRGAPGLVGRRVKEAAP